MTTPRTAAMTPRGPVVSGWPRYGWNLTRAAGPICWECGSIPGIGGEGWRRRCSTTRLGGRGTRAPLRWSFGWRTTTRRLGGCTSGRGSWRRGSGSRCRRTRRCRSRCSGGRSPEARLGERAREPRLWHAALIAPADDGGVTHDPDLRAVPTRPVLRGPGRERPEATLADRQGPDAVRAEAEHDALAVALEDPAGAGRARWRADHHRAWWRPPRPLAGEPGARRPAICDLDAVGSGPVPEPGR